MFPAKVYRFFLSVSSISKQVQDSALYLSGRKIDQLAPGQGHALAVHFDIVVAAIFDFMTEEDWESRNRNPYGRCQGEKRKPGTGGLGFLISFESKNFFVFCTC